MTNTKILKNAIEDFILYDYTIVGMQSYNQGLYREYTLLSQEGEKIFFAFSIPKDYEQTLNLKDVVIFLHHQRYNLVEYLEETYLSEDILQEFKELL